MQKYCPCREETPDPCPLCGATVEGNDKVNGVCQYPFPSPTNYGIEMILLDKRSGKIIE